MRPAARNSNRTERRRPAITLVELMVVLVIMSLLVAAVIPMMAPATQSRRLREGARALNTIIGTAQAEAVGSNRLSGIWLERLSATTNNPADRGAVTYVYYCEEPAPFSGFSDESAVVLEPQPQGAAIPTYWSVYFILNKPSVPNPYPFDPIPPGLIRPGDRLVVDGVEFELYRGTLGTDGYFAETYKLFCRLVASASSTRIKQWNYGFTYNSQSTTYPSRYQIRRMPQKTAADPLQLPAGIAIDLEASGDGSSLDGGKFGGFFHDPNRPHNPDSGPVSVRNDNDDPVIILFAPDGSLARIYRNAGYTLPVNVDRTSVPGPSLSEASMIWRGDAPRSSIHFLVGRLDHIVAADADFSDDQFTANWLDPESLWVSIHLRSGRVATSENLVPTGSVNTVSCPSSWDPAYSERVIQRLSARGFVRSNLSMGGR